MLALLLALLSPSLASTLTTCGDAPSQGCYATLQEAIDNAADTGDIIAVTEGTYQESVRIDGKDLWLQGQTGVFLLGSGQTGVPVLHLVGADVTIDRLMLASDVQPPVLTEQSIVRFGQSTLRGGAFQPNGGVLRAVDSTLSFDACTVRNGVAINGGLVYLERSSLLGVGTIFSDGEATDSGGGIAAADVDSSIELQRFSRVQACTASTGGGIQSNGAASITVSRSDFIDNHAVFQGGALSVSGGTLVAEDMILSGNHAGTGGAFHMSAADTTLTRSVFCKNTGSIGAALSSQNGSFTATNNTFWRNTSTMSTTVDVGGTPTTANIRYNHFVANEAATHAALSLPNANTTLLANLFTQNTSRTGDPSPLIDEQRTQGVINAGYNLYYANDGDAVSETLQAEQVLDDPQLYNLDSEQACTRLIALTSSQSSAVDAGPPMDQDLDGSRADIGATGGSGSDPVHWDDQDNDGWPQIYDCDETNPAINPSQPDTPYDGIDTNCDAWNDFDVDHDGYLWAGDDETDGPGDDCNDGDAATHPGAYDDPYDLVDQDCDDELASDGDGDGYAGTIHGGNDCDDYDATIHPGAFDANPLLDLDCNDVRDVEVPVTPTGCAHTPPTTALWWIAGLLLWRRRAS